MGMEVHDIKGDIQNAIHLSLPTRHRFVVSDCCNFLCVRPSPGAAGEHYGGG